MQLNAGATVTASGDGLTLAARPWDMLRRTVVLSGSAPAALAGDVVEIQRLGPGATALWAPAASAVIGSGGTFTARWIAGRAGRFSIRAVLLGSAAAIGADVATAAPAPGAPATAPMTINVYRRAFATLYGPGLYGRLTACGERLRRTTIGVANRTLPCGTQVAIYYRGESLTVPVIDRGPYANGADWDLTVATARALGLEGNAEIGTVALPRATALSQAPRLAARRR
ncbi:MAG TPA: septal ring lytic transglycosylase RlpA family protein [Solirubrobacteraceae bacterium]|nr:septal ring lytic transglycosylase RlpA family protein [Solirubrobacteraceae bacterium]